METRFGRQRAPLTPQQQERRRRFFNLALALVAIAAALTLLALNPKALTGFSSDRDRQALLADTTLGPGLSTGGAVVLTNQGVLPLRYDLLVTGPAEQTDAGVVMRVRLNDDSNYVYQGPALTRQPITLGILVPGQSVRAQVTLVAPPSAASSSIPVDDTFTWTAHSPGLETWWWLIALAAALAAAAFVLPFIAREGPAGRRPRRELFWRQPLILAALVLALLFPLSGVSLAAVNFQSANPGNLFAIGTLVLSDRAPDGTTCMSITSSSVATAPTRHCGTAFQFLNGTPGMTRSARLTVRNVGTVPIARFTVWAPNPCQSAAASAIHGTDDACRLVNLSLHDDSHDVCYFPTKAAGPCPARMSGTMSTFGRTFTTASPLGLDPEGLGGGITYTFAVQVAPAAGNQGQGLAPYIDLEWEASQ